MWSGTWYTWHYVQQGHFPSPDLAHLQSQAMLAPILSISEISNKSIKKCGGKRVHNKVSTDRQTDGQTNPNPIVPRYARRGTKKCDCVILCQG